MDQTKLEKVKFNTELFKLLSIIGLADLTGILNLIKDSNGKSKDSVLIMLGGFSIFVLCLALTKLYHSIISIINKH